MNMTAQPRVELLSSQFSPTLNPLSKIQQKDPDDVVITLAVRTPLTKAGSGAMKDTTLDGMLFKLLKSVVNRIGIDPALVEDICLGNVRDGKAPYHIRAASLAAGFPTTTTASTASRFCSSGLTATQHIANEVSSGTIDIGIAIGAESLSEGNQRLNRPFVDDILQASQAARECMQPMGQTSENVAKMFDIPRNAQDEYAVESYRRAEEAQLSGWFDDEIVPITIKQRDGKEILITQDELRHGTTYKGIARLKPSFPDYGDTTHAENSSQITDGAAALLLMKRSKALELGQPVLGKWVGSTLAGLEPRIMGIGPSLAIPKLLKRYHITLSDIDIVEINEAFASMAVYCRDNIEGLEWEKLNPRGGAIALGHPFGMTGIRQIVTGLSECRRTKKKMLLTSMCMGTGMGMAALFVNEQI